jgi:predicted small secreted protein
MRKTVLLLIVLAVLLAGCVTTSPAARSITASGDYERLFETMKVVLVRDARCVLTSADAASGIIVGESSAQVLTSPVRIQYRVNFLRNATGGLTIVASITNAVSGTEADGYTYGRFWTLYRSAAGL